MGLGHKCLRADYILEAAEDSLRRLNVEAIDLYQSHWDDETTAFDETLEAYALLMKQGKVRAIGASNLTTGRLAAALSASDGAGLPRYATLQPHYNLYERQSFEGPLQELCIREGLGVIPYFALASGFLTGKYRSGGGLRTRAQRGDGMHKFLNPRGLRILAALDAVAGRYGATPAQIALAWLMARPGVTAPIASATSVAQLDALLAATRVVLDDDARRALDDASAPAASA